MLVITTPTGQIGRQVLDNLLTSEEKLRVIVRDPSALSAEVRQRVDVIAGSHGDAEVVDGRDAFDVALVHRAPRDCLRHVRRR